MTPILLATQPGGNYSTILSGKTHLSGMRVYCLKGVVCCLGEKNI